MALFILVKKGKTFVGVIPARKKATTKELKELIKTQISKGFKAKVITISQLKRILRSMLPAKAKRILRKSKLISKSRSRNKKRKKSQSKRRKRRTQKKRRKNKRR